VIPVIKVRADNAWGENSVKMYSTHTVASEVVLPTLGYKTYDSTDPYLRNIMSFKFITSYGEELSAYCMDASWSAKSNYIYYNLGPINSRGYDSKTIDYAYRVYQYGEGTSSSIIKSETQLAMWLIFRNIAKSNSSSDGQFDSGGVYTLYREYWFSRLVDLMKNNPKAYLDDYDDGYYDYKEVILTTGPVSRPIKYTWEDAKTCFIYGSEPKVCGKIEDEAVKLLKNAIMNSKINTGESYSTYQNLREEFKKIGISDTTIDRFFSYANNTRNTVYEGAVNGTLKRYSGILCEYEVQEEFTTGNWQNFIAPCRISKFPPYDPGNFEEPDDPDDNTVRYYGKVITHSEEANCSSNSYGYNYQEYDSTVEVDEVLDMKSGIFEQDLGDYATLYCTESNSLDFPRGISSGVTVGTYLIWPTSASTITSIYGNNYSLSLSGQKVCKIELATDDTRYNTYINTKDIVTDFNSKASGIDSSSASVWNPYASIKFEKDRVDSGGKSCNAASTACSSIQTDLNTYDAINNYSGAVAAKGACDIATNNYNGKLTIYNTLNTNGTSADYKEEEAAKKDADDAHASMVSACALVPLNYDEIISGHDSRQKKLDECNTYLNRCTTYTNKIVSAIDFVNNIVALGNKTFIASSLYTKWDTKLDVSWNDEEYGRIIPDGELEKETYTTCDGCSSLNISKMPYTTAYNSVKTIGTGILNDAIPSIQGRTITAKFTTTYSLPTTNLIYNYVNKSTGKAVTSLGETEDNYTTIGYSNLPISFDSKIGIKYDLSILNISYGSDLKYSNSDYVCDYEVTKAQPGESITYRCDNKNSDGGYMDITDCVETKMTQGYGETESKKYCNSLLCSLSGIEIIYRTIDLANPFPGKNISGKVQGFNTDKIGRYPGLNWNNKALVTEKIMKNRGVTADDLYQSEPLYTFVLTSSTIKAIRKYNNSQKSDGGYADFTLDCKDDNSKACVSIDFVHNSDYGLIGGTCSDNTSVSNFYTCLGED